jgi:prepilin-type N-terminal cleavage/methylation domain-containing protein
MNLQPSTFNLQLPRRSRSAFTLIELLVVIAIIGILAGIAAPLLNTFRPNPSAVVTRSLLDAVSRARQLAISQHTTVYLVFVPTNFWMDAAYPTTPIEANKGTNLYDKQLIGYNFISLRSVGDQPGRPRARYLDSWKTLPDGAFIPVQKFGPRNTWLNIYSNNTVLAFQAYGFNVTNNIPFPAEDTPPFSKAKPYAQVPYIGFNYLGQLISGQNEMIPVTRGNVIYARDPVTKQAMPGKLPSAIEQPPGNGTTNSYNVVAIDWLTGRAHVERMKVQ